MVEQEEATDRDSRTFAINSIKTRGETWMGTGWRYSTAGNYWKPYCQSYVVVLDKGSEYNFSAREYVSDSVPSQAIFQPH